MAVIDLDHLKYVNDSFGHASGDRVLQALAHIFTKNIREIDLFARFGGDEFVLLLPETSARLAREVIERVVLTLNDSLVVLSDQPFLITFSAGISDLGSGARTVDALVERAGQALYRAKEAGRNYVMLNQDYRRRPPPGCARWLWQHTTRGPRRR